MSLWRDPPWGIGNSRQHALFGGLASPANANPLGPAMPCETSSGGVSYGSLSDPLTLLDSTTTSSTTTPALHLHISHETMPGHLGQKILKTFGLDEPKPREATPTGDVPGRADVHHQDERILSEFANNGTYPRLARLSDGSILSATTRREGPQRVLQVSKSTDGGHRFFTWGEVTRGNGDVDNLYLLEVAPNKVLAAFRNHDLGPHGPTHFRITVCQSTDGGKSWSYLSQAAEKAAPFGLWEPFMRLGRGGEVQMTFSQEFAPEDQDTMLVVSHDQGKTWSKPVVVAGADERLRDGMTGIADTRDNGQDALVMVFETTRYGTFCIEAVISYDDGVSWQRRQPVYIPPRGRNAGSPQIASFADGSLAVVFMTDEEVQHCHWPGRAAVKAVFSGPPQHGKLHWTPPTLVGPEASVWPGIMAIDEKSVLATYDHGGPRGKLITWHAK
ncbi:CAZyme family GH93 [Paecilomyces variotii]|nr:CAZyme family GH93 [Paecilomyces variotii]